MKSVAIDIRNVALSFGKTAVLRDISLGINAGEFFALLGPSGSGKSTLLRLIAGFNQHQHGSVLIDSEEVTGLPPWQRNVGMVFQNYALWPHMTVYQNVAFGLETRRRPAREIREKVAQALALVELSDFADRRPGQLSGGQQQRVAIARTLAIEPRVLLLDEPLSNLDAKLRAQTRQELVRLQKRLGITTIFVTHDQEEALTTCQRVAVMDKGIIQQVGTPMELFDTPANRFVAQFIGVMNTLPGRVVTDPDGMAFESQDLGRLSLPRSVQAPGGSCDLAFRPHVVSLDGPPRDDHLQFDGVIEAIEFLGECVRYDIRAKQGLVKADIAHFRNAPMLSPGKAVTVAVPATELRWIQSG